MDNVEINSHFIDKEGIVKHGMEMVEVIKYERGVHEYFHATKNRDATDEFGLETSPSQVQNGMKESTIIKSSYIWSDDEIQNDISEEESTGHNCKTTACDSLKFDLNKDIQDNLNLLGQLYPEMSGRKLTVKSYSMLDDYNQVNTNEFVGKRTSGWNKVGLMHRYDPTAPSAQSFEICRKGNLKYDNIHETKNSSLIDDIHVSEQEDTEFFPGENNYSHDENKYLLLKDQALATMVDNCNGKEEWNESEKCDISNILDENAPGKLRTTPTSITSLGKSIFEQKKLENIFQGERATYDNFHVDQSVKDEVSYRIEECSNKSHTSTLKPTDSVGFTFEFDISQDISDKPRAAKRVSVEHTNAHIITEVGTLKCNTVLSKDSRKWSTSTLDCTIEEAGSDIVNPYEDVRICHYGETSENVPQCITTTSKGRKCVTYPVSTLLLYEKYFFEMNEGSEIMTNVESMKHNKKSQTEWLVERKRLTLDWKRKRKYALSRKCKHRKYK